MLDIIFSRRSIRKYETREIPEDVLQNVLKAGFYAPTARNLQPWHFVVVKDREKLEGIMQAQPYTTMLATAPAAVIVCGDSAVSDDYWADDCAAASENILLAAKSMGLGSCWCALYPNMERMEKIAELLGLPENIKPYNVIAIGYAAEEREMPARDYKSRIHINAW